MSNDRPFAPMLCRVMAGFQDDAFLAFSEKIQNEEQRRGELAEHCTPSRPPDGILSGMDNLGWVVLTTAWRAEVRRRTAEREHMRERIAERIDPREAARVDELPLPAPAP